MQIVIQFAHKALGSGRILGATPLTSISASAY